jgi:hypothetical protein
MNDLADELADFLTNWILTQGTRAIPPRLDSSRPSSARQIASAMLQAAESGEVRTAAFLASPDGHIVRLVATRLVPPPARWEVDLLVDAVQLAALEVQQRRARAAALATVSTLVLVVVILFRYGPG